MKKALQYSFLTAFLLFSTVLSLKAQSHAGQQSGGNVTGDRIGGGAGAPLGSGTFLLIGLADCMGGLSLSVNGKGWRTRAGMWKCGISDCGCENGGM